MNVKTLHDARWSCSSCGACCRGFSFGPVEPEVIADLERRAIAEAWEPAGQGPWHRKSDMPDGSSAYFLTHRDGHCVFLQEDSLCAIHKLFGEESKPWFCREYPFHVVELGDELRAMVRADCGGLHHSFATGAPVGTQAQAAAHLPRVVSRNRWEGDHVVVLPGVGISMDNWLQVEPILLQQLSVPCTPEQAVAQTRQMLLKMANRTAPSVQKAQYQTVLRSILSTLAQGARDDAPEMFRAKLDRAGDMIDQAMARLDEPMPDLDVTARTYLSVILRGQILTGRFGTHGLPSLFGLFVVDTTIARLACLATNEPLSAMDLGETLSMWKRLVQLPPLWQRLKGMRSALEALYMAAGSTP